MEERLDGLRAVVTGSTRGLGEGIARDLAGRGAHVVVNGTDAERCAALADELGGTAVPGSVAAEAVAEALMAGGVDLLVNNAGVARDGMLGRMSPEAFDEVIAVHLRGTWLASRAASIAMRAGGGGGAIVNIVSGTALFGNVGQSNYAAAKGGVLALTRALSLELARMNIRVNALAPTAMTEMVQPLFDMSPDGVDLREHFGDPAAIAPIVAYLATAEITGQVLGFDGRKLSVWSHPTILRREVREAWTVGEIAGALADGDLATLGYDELGAAVLGLMGIDASPQLPG